MEINKNTLNGLYGVNISKSDFSIWARNAERWDARGSMVVWRGGTRWGIKKEYLSELTYTLNKIKKQ